MLTFLSAKTQKLQSTYNDFADYPTILTTDFIGGGAEEEEEEEVVLCAPRWGKIDGGSVSLSRNCETAVFGQQPAAGGKAADGREAARRG